MKTRFLALAALVLGLASCQTEPEGLNVNVGGEVDATIAISIPETETRYGDGSNSALGVFNNGILGTENDNVTMRYLMQIFDEGGRASDTYYVDYSDGKTVNFDVRLVPNRDYTFVVWADVVVNGENDVDNHYKTKNDADKVDLTNISLLGTWNPMDESRDAFTVTELVEDYTGASIINLELKRPFAKLRIVTTDMEQLNDLAIMPSKATVEYTTTHYGAFNAYEGKVIGDSKNRNIKHENFSIVAYDEDVENDADMTIFTDYFFAKSEDEVVNFNLSVYEENGTIIGKTINFNTPIPARRNYLTTISGNILTDGNKIEVTVTDEFANAGTSTNAPYYQETISSVAELLAAINANNGEYILISDLDVNEVTASTLAATRAASTGTTINLNGYTIKLQKDIVIPEGNTLIINNDPVDNAGDKLGAVVNDGGKLVNNGTLNIEGGAFGANTIENNGKVNVNGDDVDADAIVNGEDAVVGSFIYNIEDLKAAVKNAVAGTANEFTFAANIEGEVTIVQKEGVNITIDGAGFEFDGTITIDGNWRGDEAEFVKFQNIKFNAKDASKYYNSDTGSMNFIYAPFNIGDRQNLYAHNIIVDHCTFNGGETVVGLHTRQANKITVTNSTFTGMHSLGQIRANRGYAKFDRVTVECLSGINFNDQAVNIEISNSSITATEEDGYAIRMDAQNPGNVLVNGCTFTADRPVIARRLTSSFDLEFTGNNNLVTDETYQIVLTNVKDDVAYVAPTGTYTLTGAETYNVFPAYRHVSTEAELKDAFAVGIRNISLNADIALTEAWTPVGNAEKPWYGVFDGKNHKISGLTVEGVEYAAFISHTAANSTVKNLTLENVDLNSTKHAAGVVCVAGEGLTLENVKVSGNIVAASYAGGIMHNGANATIKNCENNANVTANRAGGIASWATVGANIEGVINYGNITGAVGASGIAHGFAGTIKNAVNHGNVSSANVEAAAGIAGVQKAASTYEYCYNYGNVTSTYDDANASAAGILGQSAGSASTLKYCANYGEIKAEKSYAAGIAYSLYGTINASYCYNNGAVYGADGAGAIAPKAQYGAGDKANYCLNAGTITSEGKVYQGSNNNVSSFYYNNGELLNVSNNTVTTANDALAALNGGTDANFFKLDNGVIVVK